MVAVMVILPGAALLMLAYWYRESNSFLPMTEDERWRFNAVSVVSTLLVCTLEYSLIRRLKRLGNAEADEPRKEIDTQQRPS